MRQKFVAANWKMFGNIEQNESLIRQLLENLDVSESGNVVILPPAIYLPQMAALLKNTPLQWGAQNVYPADSGAFTGEISGSMLKEYGCRYVLVGHSERRKIFHEDENFITRKFHHAKDHGMIAVLCVGETLEEREKGLTEQVIAAQIHAVSNDNANCFNQCIIAYEPVWAIGTGITATPEQAQDVHAYIRTLIADINPEAAARISLLYGGSVTEKNAQALFSMPDVDGGLVGGASLDATRFVEIVKCIN